MSLYKSSKVSTLTNKEAVSGGTDVSLVTTGEKYNWNHYALDIESLYALIQGKGSKIQNGPVLRYMYVEHPSQIPVVTLGTDYIQYRTQSGTSGNGDRRIGFDYSNGSVVNDPIDCRDYNYFCIDMEAVSTRYGQSDRVQFNIYNGNGNTMYTQLDKTLGNSYPITRQIFKLNISGIVKLWFQIHIGDNTGTLTLKVYNIYME